MSNRKYSRDRTQRSLPPVGTSLTGRSRGKEYHAVIIADAKFPDKRAVEFKGTLYKSLTAAAKAVTDYSVNGWRFWKIK